MLWNRFCPGFPLRFGFCFRQPVGCLFCQMADFLHGMVGGIRDFAARSDLPAAHPVLRHAAPAEAAERKHPCRGGTLPAARI